MLFRATCGRVAPSRYFLRRRLLEERIAIKGRGGTDFRPGFVWLSDQGLCPSCCLYLTDMECGRYPEAEPDYPVIWCNWGPPPSARNRQPWGERIDIQP